MSKPKSWKKPSHTRIPANSSGLAYTNQLYVLDMENDIRNSVMVIASGPKITQSMPQTLKQVVGPHITKTIGSCFLFIYQNQFCVATCRHVVEDIINSPEQCKVIIRYKTSRGSINGTILPLDSSSAKFHPAYTKDPKYDIAIFTTESTVVSYLPIQVWNLNHQKEFPVLDNNTRYELIGYPIANLTLEKIKNPSTLIQPTELEVSFLATMDDQKAVSSGQPISTDRVFNFIVKNAKINLEGASGGLAFIETRQDYFAFGIISSVGTGIIQNTHTGPNKHVSLVNVIPLSWLIDTILH